MAQVLHDAKKCLNDVADLGKEDKELTFENCILPLMCNPCYKTNSLVCQAKHLQHCSTDEVIREAATKATTAFANMKKESKTRKDVYATVKKFSEQADSMSKLGEYEKHYVGAILETFERGGLGLNEADAEKLSKLLADDAEVCNKYKTNLGEDKTKLEFEAAQLEGCDEDWIKEKTDKDSGKVVLTLKYPDILPVLQNCAIAETRKSLSMAKEKAYGNNLDLVAEGINLRKQSAEILGFKSWAHFITSGRMSGSPEKVHEFLGGILDKAKPGALNDKERLRKLKEKHLLTVCQINRG